MTKKRKMRALDKNEIGSLPEGGRGVISLVQMPKVSTRCRERHDTPGGWSARCVLEAAHAWEVKTIPERPGMGVVQMHEDKHGNRW